MKSKRKFIVMLALVMLLSAFCALICACGGNSVEKITISKSNNYFMVGDEFGGVDVQVTYIDGTVENVTLDGDYVKGFDTSVAGNKTVIITYKNKTIEWNIEVSDLYINSLAVKNGSVQSFVQDGEYHDGDIVLVVTYTDGSSREVAVTEEMISFSSSTVGTVPAVIEYGGRTLTHSVSVREPYVTAAVVNGQTKTRYFYGDEFDSAVLDVTYENGKEEVVEITDAEQISGFDATTVGDQRITLTYKNFNVTYDVVVKKKMTASSVVDNKEVYTKEGAFEDGGTLQIVYHDGTTDDIPLTADMVEGFDSSAFGRKTLTAEYDGYSAEFDVFVANVTEANYYKLQVEDLTFYDYDRAVLQNNALTPFENTTRTGEKDGSGNDVNVPNGAEGYSTANISKVGNTIVIKFWSSVEGTFKLGTRAQSASGSGKSDQVLSEAIAIKANGVSQAVIGTLNRASITGGNWTNMDQWTLLDGITESIALVKGENTVEIECIAHGTIRFPNFDYFTLLINDYDPLTAIEATLNTQTKTAYEQGDTFDKVLLDVVCVNGTTRTVEITDASQIIGFDTSTTGTKHCSVTYQGITVEFDVEIAVPISSIGVSGQKEVYALNESFAEGATLNVLYGDGATDSLPLTADMLSGFDTSSVGRKTVTVTYGAKETTFDIIVALVSQVGEYKIQAEDETICDYSQVKLQPNAANKFENTTTVGSGKESNGAEGYSTCNITVKGNKLVIRFYSAVEGTFILGTRAQSGSGAGKNDQVLSEAIAIKANGISQAVIGTLNRASITGGNWTNMNQWTEIDITESITLVKGENTVEIECLIDAGAVRFPNFDYFTLTVASTES